MLASALLLCFASFVGNSSHFSAFDGLGDCCDRRHTSFGYRVRPVCSALFPVQFDGEKYQDITIVIRKQK